MSLDKLFKLVGLKWRPRLYGTDEAYENNVQFTPLHKTVVMFKICFEIADFMRDLVPYITDKADIIRIYYRGSVGMDALRFFRGLDIKHVITLGFEELLSALESECDDEIYETVDTVTRFKFESLGSRRYNDMLSLFQHSLPVVFISGDQTLTDFITVNVHIGVGTCKVYYQIFSWKQSLAYALTHSTGELIAKINAVELIKVKTNPNNDFRYAGMAFVSSAIYCASSVTRPSTSTTKLLKLFELLDALKPSGHEEKYEEYVYTDTSYNMSMSVDDDGVLVFKHPSVELDTKVIMGRMNPDGSHVSWISRSEFESVLPTFQRGKNNVLSLGLHMLLRHLVLERVRKSVPIARKTLQRTLSCYITLPEFEQRNILAGELVRDSGVVIIKDSIDGYESLDRLILEERITDETIIEVVSRVADVMSMLYMSSYSVVHNNLICRNVLVISGNPDGIRVIITGFDHAVFVIDGCAVGRQTNDFYGNYKRDMQTFYDDIKKMYK